MTAVTALDPFGNPLSLQQPASAAAVCHFVEGFLAYEPRILQVLAAAEQDDSLIVQACAAVLWLFSESPVGPPRARAHLQRARTANRPCTERERLFAQAVAHWADGQVADALTLHTELARRFPRDLAALKLGQVHAFNLGDSPAMLRLALAAAPAVQDLAWAHGLLAFGYEQCHWLDEAEASARRALALRPAEPWAEHALAHVMLTDGRLREGLAFMQQASPPWRGLTSFMRTHNWWHLALFELELGDGAAALRRYDDEVWGVDTSYSQDQVGAVSLLARLELAGVDVGARWQRLADHLCSRTADQVQPFLDMQYLYGLARAGRPEADVLLANIAAFAPNAPPDVRQAWQQVALPACRGLLAHGRLLHRRADGPPGALHDTAHHSTADTATAAHAAAQLALALPQLARIGGSHAQRDLFEQLYLDALQRAGQWAGAQNLLQPRANAQPQSQRLRRQLRAVNAALGLPARGGSGH
jgi:hypothetical protein